MANIVVGGQSLASALRNAKGGDQATVLRQALESNLDKIQVTNSLLDAVTAGELAPSIFSIWLTFANDPDSTVTVMRQDASIVSCRHAIKHFARLLLNGATFDKAWATIGEAAGIAAWTSTLSVSLVNLFYRALGRRSPSAIAQPKFQKAMTRLLAALCSSSSSLDDRQLEAIFGSIAPVCDVELAMTWERRSDELTIREQRFQNLLHQHHPKAIQQLLAKRCFEGESISKSDFQFLVNLIKKDLAFGISFLERFAQEDSMYGIDAKEFMYKIMIPIARRCQRKQKEYIAAPLQYWKAAIKLLQQHESLRQFFAAYTYYATKKHHQLMYYAVQSWRFSLCAPHDEHMLASFLQCVPKTAASVTDLEQYICWVPWELRYPLLRIFFRNLTGFEFEIESSTSAEKCPLGRLKTPPRPDLFLLLPAHEGLGLLERCIAANPSMAVLSRGNGYYNHYLFKTRLVYSKFTPDIDHPDPHLLRAILLREADGNKLPPFIHAAKLLEHFNEELEQRKKKAAHARTPELRVFWASSSLFLSAAIGSLSGFKDTVSWARRFSKDPASNNDIHSTKVFDTEEIVDLLAVLPRRIRDSANLKIQTSQAIQTANAVFFELFETVLLSGGDVNTFHQITEPMVSLVGKVFRRRIEAVNGFQDRTSLSDDEIFDTVWKTSIEDMASLESKILPEPHFSRLKSGHNHAWLQLGTLEKLRDPTMKFLDRMAESRNQVWETYRCRENPSVMTLEAPWPRGLPIQKLWNFSLDDWQMPVDFPYLHSRAKSIVFGDASLYMRRLRRDQETVEAVDGMVDSWPIALKIYVGSLTEAERAERLKRAWTYASTELSRRLEPSETNRYWEPYFERFYRFSKDEAPFLQDSADITTLLKFDTDDMTEPVEWNPNSMLVSQDELRYRVLGPAVIDSLLTAQFFSSDNKHIIPTTTVPAVGRKMFWRSFEDNLDGCSSGKVDVLLAASLLYLNDYFGADSSIMMKPVPEAREPRFPALFLDQDFINKKASASKEPSNLIAKFRNQIPVQIFSRFASSIYRKSKDEEPTPITDPSIIALLKAFERCDNPSAALSIIERFIVEMPQNSAWHRNLLNTGFLRSLTPKESEGLLMCLCEILLEKHAQQPATRPPELRKEEEEPKAKENNASKSAVKITTLKMLVQVLRDYELFKPRFALELLVRVLKGTGHIDIHLAAFESLLCLAKNSSDESFHVAVLNVFRESALRRASSLDERRPEGRKQWEVAEKGGDLPAVWDIANGCPPVLEMLMQAATSLPEAKGGLRAGFNDVLHETVRMSAAANQRWMNLFMRKHGFTLPDEEKLPRIPIFPAFLAELLRRSEGVMPPDLFAAMEQMLLLKMNPGPALRAINKEIKDDAVLRHSAPGKHWLAFWGTNPDAVMGLGGRHVAQLLRSYTNGHTYGPSNKDIVTTLENFILNLVDAALAHANVQIFNIIMSSLQLSEPFGPSYRQAHSNNDTILERVIQRVEALRTPEWQNDTRRRPVILPSVFPLKLKLIHLPESIDEDMDETSASTTARSVCDRIVALIDGLTSSGKPYHTEFAVMTSDFTSRLHSSVPVSIALGSPVSVIESSRPSPTDYLRVELAAAMLAQRVRVEGLIKRWPEEQSEGARSMVCKWAMSTVEEFRLQAKLVIPHSESVEAALAQQNETVDMADLADSCSEYDSDYDAFANLGDAGNERKKRKARYAHSKTPKTRIRLS